MKAASIASKTAQGSENSLWAVVKSARSAPAAAHRTAYPVTAPAAVRTRSAAGGFDDRREILRRDSEISGSAGDRGLSIPSERAREQNRRRGGEHEHEFAHRFLQVFIDRTRKAFTRPVKKATWSSAAGQHRGGYDLFVPRGERVRQYEGTCRGNHLIALAYSNRPEFLSAPRARPGDNWLRA